MTQTEATYVQPARVELRGRRQAVYSPGYVRTQMAKVIRRSAMWNEYREEREEYADGELQRFIDGNGIGGFYFEVKRAFALDCSLNIKDHWEGTDNSDAEFTVVDTSIGVQVNWSSTNRDVAEAQASIALYSEMTNLAATLQTIASGYHIAVLRPKPTE